MPIDSIRDVIHLHLSDNICVAVRPLAAGDEVKAGDSAVRLNEPIKAGHKIALCDIPLGKPVLKYGQVIGFATSDVRAGDWIHSHNLSAGFFERDYAKAQHTTADPTPLVGRTFQGFRRANGRAGTRNYLAIISTVNCSAAVSRMVAAKFDRVALAAFPNVDGVVAFTHPGGCGMQYDGEHHRILSRTLGGIAKHPNIGGYLIIGLGCESGTIGYLVDDQRLVQIEPPSQNGAAATAASGRRPIVMSMQDMGGTQKTIEAASQKVAELLPQVNQFRRETISASEICLALKCGGSDGNSGITANPALGVASDMLVAAGGTAILGETPEIYGAEQLLTRRARTPQVADKLIERIAWWEKHTAFFGASMDNNPSPGNKEGGLTTIYEKSLGAVAKAGNSAMNEVYLYAEPVTAHGLVVMDTPGFDPVCVTGMVAGGANVVVFTTGRGSCFGCKPAPSIKVATNTPLYNRMPGDMDLDAGPVLHGASIETIGQQLFEEILAVASGKKTKSEQLGLGDDEFAPWHLGPTL